MTEVEKINWLVPDKFPALHPREIHLWCAWLEPPDASGPDRADCLSRDERARAASFHFAVDRHRYVAARRNLRHLLGQYVRRDPASLVFRYGRFGKPMLIHRADTNHQLDPAVCNLAFNQSHCGSLWLIAVAWNQPLGVDLEQVRELTDLYLLENRVFSADELVHQQTLPHPERRLAFFRRWTEREAAAKFHGLGFDPAKPCVPPGHSVTLHPTARCVATLAYGGAAIRPDKFQWSPVLRKAAPPPAEISPTLRFSPEARAPAAALS